MADRYLLESSAVDGYQLEDGSGVLLLEVENPLKPNLSLAIPPRQERGFTSLAVNLLLTTLAVITVVRAPLFVNERQPTREVIATQAPNLLVTTLGAVATPPPFINSPHIAPARALWQPDDTSAGVPKPLTADAQLPIGDAPHWAPIAPVRLVADTMQEQALVLQAVVAIPPFVPELWPVVQSARQVFADTTLERPLVLDQAPFVSELWQAPQSARQILADGTRGEINPDARAPVGQEAAFAPIALVRNVVDTSLKQPITLQVIVVPPPIVNPPQYGPVRVLWQPADTSEGASKGLIPDAQLPVGQEPAFAPIALVRNVVDTSQSTPEVLLPVVLPPGEASFVGLQRFWHQTPDTSQSTQRTLDPVSAPVGKASFVGLQRALWQPEDTSQGAYGVVFPPTAILPPPPGLSLVLPVPQYAWPVTDTTQQSPPVAIQNVQPVPPVVTVPPVPDVGSGKPKRKRHYVEIDGQYFEVRDHAHAVEILTALHEAAKEAAPAAVEKAAAQKAVPVIPRMVVVKPDRRIDFVRELQGQVDAVNAKIADEYKAAQESYQAWQLAMAKSIADEEDDINALIALGIL